MGEVNMVTIPLEEYMDLRDKANMNGFLMKELGQMDSKFQDIDRRLWELEKKTLNNELRNERSMV